MNVWIPVLVGAKDMFENFFSVQYEYSFLIWIGSVCLIIVHWDDDFKAKSFIILMHSVRIVLYSASFPFFCMNSFKA